MVLGNIIAIAERTVQDTANTATTTGLNGANVASGVADYLPGSTIQRGKARLMETDKRLQDHVLPLNTEILFYAQHDRLWATGEQLTEAKKKLAAWSPRQVAMLTKAFRFEKEAMELHAEVHNTSHWFESVRSRRYTPSIHTLDSGWEVDVRAPSPIPTVPSTSADDSGTVLPQQLGAVQESGENEEIEELELRPCAQASDGQHSAADGEP
ncbi:hypothetical protein OH77DRAFT_1518583 [Trametes cingulata]|nr:hypothetical protein OH77DRAFT_1518583 [Trametes cingulata]